jgi:hypothetical protein
MELFKRNPFVRNQVQETEPQTITSFAPVEDLDSETAARNWPMLAALAIAAVAFIVLVVVSSVWIYHKLNNNPAPSNTTQSLPKPPPQDLTPNTP